MLPKIAVILTGIAAFVFLLYVGCSWFEHRTENPEVRGDYTQRYTYDHMLELDGISYRRRKNITTILLMGIDAESTESESQTYRHGGQADFLYLLAIDDANKTVNQIQIDRDTMTPITILGVLGNKSGMRTAQIGLSHGFGDGKSQSCELTVEAVSNLFLGLPIDFYAAMHLDGISILNDEIGGVTVTLEDDFSSLDSSMIPGARLTLMGDQAEWYLRGRSGIGIGTNQARMDRQAQYISSFSDLLYERIAQDEEFAGRLYDRLAPYLTTNLSRGRMINELWAAKDYEKPAVVKLQGVHEVGADGFMRFYPDEAELQRMVTALFYERVE